MFSSIIKFIPRFGFAKEVTKAGSATGAASNLTYYKDGQLVNRTQIQLKKKQDIEAYVIKTIQNYFRTTYKNGVTRESTLNDHGLDSLDAIEIAMQLEEDLGYVISAETLSQFQKVKHYINYIEQVEGFKRDNNGQVPLP